MTGQTHPVLLLHGWGGSFASTWVANGWTADIARAGRRVIPIDLPGHGQAASRAPGAYADLADQVRQALPRQPVDIIAYSLGAKIALALASAERHLFGKIVVAGVGDNLFAPEPDGEGLALLLLGDRRSPPSPRLRALADYAVANGNNAAAMAAILRRTPNPQLSPADLPNGRDICIANSDADMIAMPDGLLTRTMPLARRLRIAGISHLELPAHPPLREAAMAFLND